MSDEDKTFSGSFVLDLRIWWRQAHTLYNLQLDGVTGADSKIHCAISPNQKRDCEFNL